MLRIRFGVTDDTILGIDRHFNSVFERSWFDNQLVREMIRDVDKSEVISGSAIDSPVLGPISPRELSGGVKTLICMLMEPELEYYGTSCGNNCGKWMVEIGKLQDVTVAFEHILEFRPPSEATVGGLNAVCVNTGQSIDNMQDVIAAYTACDALGVFDA